VKIIRTPATAALTLHFSNRERDPFLALLGLYPLVPPAHQRLSKTSVLPEQEGSQRLLDDALAEQRKESKAQLQALLADLKHFQTDKTGCRLSLSLEETEWMLQVLNDIRVGAWVLLGSPEELPETVDEKNAAHVWAMETAGYLQMTLLEAIKS
jgi:hypothetical protein